MSIEITPELLSDLRQKAEAATIEYDWKLYDEKKGWPVIEFGNRPGEDCGGFTIKGNYSPKLNQDAAHIAAANPAVVLALVAEIAKLKVESIEKDIQRAEGVLRMFRGEQQDFAGLFSEAELIVEGLDKPADIDGTTAGIWASFIERKQLEVEQYRSLVK